MKTELLITKQSFNFVCFLLSLAQKNAFSFYKKAKL